MAPQAAYAAEPAAKPSAESQQDAEKTAATKTGASEPQIFFYPAKKWTVNAKADPQNPDMRVCKASNEFNNGFVVTLQGTEKWVQAMTVDFRQDAFKTGETYEVSLTVPGLNHKTLGGNAASARLLKIGMSGEKDFYQTMRDSSVFDLKIDDNHFRFYMVGFSNVARDFERCMAGEDGKNSGDAVNEAIAMEEKEKQQKAPPKVAPPPKKENIKKAESKPESKPESEPAVQKESEELLEAQAEPVPEALIPADKEMPEEVAKAPVEPVAKSTPVKSGASVAQIAAAPSRPKAGGRPRLSEMLAAQMEKDPTLSGVKIIDGKIVNVKTGETMAALEKPATIAGASVTAPDSIMTPIPGTAPVEPVAVSKGSPAPQFADKAPKMAMNGKNPADMEPAGDEPFAKPGLKIPADLKDEPGQQAAIDLPAPAGPDASALLAQPELSASKSIKKQEVKVTRSTAKSEADFTKLGDVEPAAAPASADAIDVAEVPAKMPAANAQMRDLQKKIALLEKQNNDLNNELKTALNESQEERLDISSDNWNLEQATKLYNESERQLKRLGQELQQERARCSVEKQDLETMLFDPKLTDEKQMAKLSELQQQVSDYERRVKELEELLAKR